MNEKIRKLMQEAVISIDGKLWGETYIPDAFTEKFAGLIVQECANVADSPDADMLRVGSAIKEHFGVK